MPVRLIGSTSGYSELSAPAEAGDQLFSLPETGGTLVTTDGTQTLTNKTIQGGTLTLETAQASTSGTAVDFTGIPSWVKRITVMFDQVSTNGTSNYLIQIGDAGGIETTGYLSYSCRLGVTGIGGGANYTTGFGMSGNNASYVYSGSAAISSFGSNTWCINGLYAETSSDVGIPVSGAKTLSDTLTQIRITSVNGTDTFDAGTINIMYEG